MTSTGSMTMCAIEVAGQRFGLDTRQVREVIGDCPVQRVPLSPLRTLLVWSPIAARC